MLKRSALLLATLSSLLVAGPAAAQEDDEDEGEEEYENEEGPDIGNKPEQPKENPFAGPWDKKPYVRPVVGASFYTDNSGQSYTALTGGAEGGFHYWQEKPDPYLRGTARARGTLTFGSGVSGYEVRVGNFLGPWYKFIGATTGPDIFYNQYQYGGTQLPGTLGLTWPIIATIGVKVFSVYGGGGPSYFFSSDRDTVDWGSEPNFGFGHEFMRMIGATLDAKALSISVSYTSTITAYGTDNALGVGLRI